MLTHGQSSEKNIHFCAVDFTVDPVPEERLPENFFAEPSLLTFGPLPVARPEEFLAALFLSEAGLDFFLLLGGMNWIAVIATVLRYVNY